MAQRTVYDSGPIAGPGTAKKVAALTEALAAQYPSKTFELHHVEGTEPTPAGGKRAVHRLVVARKGRRR